MTVGDICNRNVVVVPKGEMIVDAEKRMRTSHVGDLAMRRAWQVVCALRGHEMVLHFEPRRLSLQCLACGAQTQGWTIDVNECSGRAAYG